MSSFIYNGVSYTPNNLSDGTCFVDTNNQTNSNSTLTIYSSVTSHIVPTFCYERLNNLLISMYVF